MTETVHDIATLRDALASDDAPMDQAMAIAERATSVAWAFAGAYINAQRRLFGISSKPVTALCVTEDGGNGPKAIETTFANGRATGTKSFVTFGEDADLLYLLCSRGTDATGSKDLVLARVRRSDATVEHVIQTPFMPEAMHARMRFDDAPAELLRDDAWPLIRAFRFVEDVFVLGAVCRYLGARLPDRRLLALSHSARSLADAPVDDPTAHVTYDGLFTLARETIEGVDWTQSPELAAQWQRDQKILAFASAARQARLEKAEALLAHQS